VYLGLPWFWPGYWPGYYYDYPAYTYYDYPAYNDYPTEVYAEPQGAAPSPARSRYYCPDIGYYPSVQACPQGWLRVLPNSGAPQ